MNANLTGKIVFLTGATGFLGSHLLKRLMKEKCVVHASIRKTSPLWRIEEFKDEVIFHEVDLTDFKTVKSLIHQIKPEIIFHFAAYGVDYRQQDIFQAINVNINASVNLFEAFLEISGHRFIHTGTCLEYGHKKTIVSEDDIPAPVNVYGATKLCAAHLLSAMGMNIESGNLIILRPFGTFGENEDINKFVPYIIGELGQGHTVRMTPGVQIRDYIYIDDLVDAYILSAIVPLENKVEIVNIGSGKEIIMKDFALMISKQLGDKDNLLQFGALSYRPEEMMYLVANVSKAKSLLGWEAKVSIEEGISNTLIRERINHES